MIRQKWRAHAWFFGHFCFYCSLVFYILRAFLKKQFFHSRLLDMKWLQLSIISYPTRAHGIVVTLFAPVLHFLPVVTHLFGISNFICSRTHPTLFSGLGPLFLLSILLFSQPVLLNLTRGAWRLLFAVVLQNLNCTALSQSESSNFYYYYSRNCFKIVLVKSIFRSYSPPTQAWFPRPSQALSTVCSIRYWHAHI